MKHTLLAAVILGAAVAGVAALVEDSAAGPTVGGGTRSAPAPPQTEFVVDYPPVLLGPPMLTYDVPVTNTTGRRVTFDQVACLCACSETSRPKDSLDPGESMVVRLIVRPGSRYGPDRFSCSWSDQDGNRWAVVARVTLLRQEQFEERRVSFGTVEPGQTATAGATFKQHALKVEGLPPVPDFRSDHPRVKVTVAGTTTEQTPDGYACRTVRLIVTTTVMSGDGEAGALIRPVPVLDAMSFASTLVVDWKVSKSVDFFPSRVVFTPGGPKTVRVLFRNEDGKELKLHTAKVSHPDRLSVTFPPAGSGGAVMAVTLLPGASAERLVGEIVVETSGTGSKSVAVPYLILAGEGRP